MIKVHFYYGSKPKFKYRHEEHKHFGGLHGGHVSIEIGDSVFSFSFKGKAHILAHKKNLCGLWYNENKVAWVRDTVGDKYASVIIPLTKEKFDELKAIQGNYCGKETYDYAFLGMRCASAAYDVFSQLGFFKQRSRISMVTKIFYSKRLRKRFFRLAKINKWEIVKHDGNPKRKWERK